MISKKVVLGAAAACAALMGLSATAANAQGWWGQGYGYDRGGYGGQGYYGGGYSADQLVQRENWMGQRIQRMSYGGQLDRDEAGRAWRMLNDARRQTMHEAREHGGLLPAHDYQEIANRLNGLDQFLRHEAREDDDD